MKKNKLLVVLLALVFIGTMAYTIPRVELLSRGAARIDGKLYQGGDIQMGSGEILSNSTDADLTLTFDDDAATLGQVIFISTNDSANIADNDLLEMLFRFYDDSLGATDWGEVEVKATDVSDESEDSEIHFKAWTGGTAGTALALDGDGVMARTINYLADTSSANDTYGGTITPAPAALTEGMFVFMQTATANTGAATLAFNGLTVKNIKTASGADPANSDIVASGISLLVYDGTNWVLLNPATTCD